MANNKNKQFFQGKECFTRMNFLYQASMLMAGKNNALSAHFGELCKNISKKAVLRIDPEVKRNLCKRCSLAQKPGITAELIAKTNKTRAARRRRKAVKTINNLDDNTQILMTCSLCGRQRNFVVNTEYKFWLENPESVAEVNTLKLEERTSAGDIKATKEKHNGKEKNGKELRKELSKETNAT